MAGSRTCILDTYRVVLYGEERSAAMCTSFRDEPLHRRGKPTSGPQIGCKGPFTASGYVYHHDSHSTTQPPFTGSLKQEQDNRRRRGTSAAWSDSLAAPVAPATEREHTHVNRHILYDTKTQEHGYYQEKKQHFPCLMKDTARQCGLSEWHVLSSSNTAMI
jgi:hypothetical protein